MSGEELIRRLGLVRYGHQWRGACPACGYGSNAFVLSINRDRSLSGWCASCQDREGIAAALKGAVATHAFHKDFTRKAKDAEKMMRIARSAWLATVEMEATPAELYLQRRGVPWLMKSEVLRFSHSATRPDGTGLRYPAMVAAVTSASGDVVAIHRTYLTADGRKDGKEPVRASLGPVRGGSIRLQPYNPKKPLIVAEGIETAASAGKLMKAPAWAAGSAGNLGDTMVLPEEIRNIIVAADTGAPGERAAAHATLRWRGEGRTVRIATPDEGDFNDLLLKGGK